MAKTGSPLHDPERKRSDPSMRDPECKSSQMALLIPICAAAGGAQCVILRGLCQTAKSHSFSVSPVLCSTYLQPSDLAGLLCHPFCLQNAKVIPEVCVAAMGLNLLPTWLVLVSMGSIQFLGMVSLLFICQNTILRQYTKPVAFLPCLFPLCIGFLLLKWKVHLCSILCTFPQVRPTILCSL